MTNEITSTTDMAEREWDGRSEPGEVDTDMVATKEAEGKGIEFHISMRDYTMSDMEGLIVDAAANLIVGNHREAALTKAIEAKAIALIDKKASEALSAVTTAIIDQPLIPSFGDKKPVTMREFIGLTGREYLTARVDSSGRPTTDTYGTSLRIEQLVRQYMDRAFKTEIEKATSTAIIELRANIKAQHEAFLAAERKRFAEALSKTVGL